MLYCKEEGSFGENKNAGLHAIARLVDSGVCVAITYAVVRDDSSRDSYLAELLKRVDMSRIMSGIGERPAIIYVKHWGLPGFTTGSGCVAPHLSQAIFAACVRRDWETAEELRRYFLPLEDYRDEKGPARVLYHATQLAGVEHAGAIPPYVSPLSPAEFTELQHWPSSFSPETTTISQSCLRLLRKDDLQCKPTKTFLPDSRTMQKIEPIDRSAHELRPAAQASCNGE